MSSIATYTLNDCNHAIAEARAEANTSAAVCTRRIGCNS